MGLETRYATRWIDFQNVLKSKYITKEAKVCLKQDKIFAKWIKKT